MTSYRVQGLVPVVVLAFGGRVIGMHAHTGERLWEHVTARRAGALRIATEAGRVFVLSGELSCLDQVSGELVWKVSLPMTIGPTPSLLPYASTVVVADMGEAACFAMEDGNQLWHDGFPGFGVANVAIAVPGANVQIDS